MSEPLEILAAIKTALGMGKAALPLAGRRAIVTSGPTWEAIDPVRFIANRSSGKQGHAIASALQSLGAEVTLISGPTGLVPPNCVTQVNIESARDMLSACMDALPADIAVCAAAVADWRVAAEAGQKIKKNDSGQMPTLSFAENPDILKAISNAGVTRPGLVVGFAAETENLIANAQTKLARKGCDWILANDVSAGTEVFGGDANTLHLVTASAVEAWPTMNKIAAAEELAARISAHFSPPKAEATE
jgi:phosphopantothenoylcysteine decarboxylase/phosphopantothenate--cysteine ligase